MGKQAKEPAASTPEISNQAYKHSLRQLQFEHLLVCYGVKRINYADKNEKLVLPDPQIVLTYDAACLENGVLAP